MDDTSREPIEQPDQTSRRAFLKKSAVAGAVVWSAPAITTLSSGKVWATEYPEVEPTELVECDAEATALIVRLLGEDLLVVGHAEDPEEGKDCLLELGDPDELAKGVSVEHAALDVLGLVSVAAEVACGEVKEETSFCSAEAIVLNLTIGLGGGLSDLLSTGGDNSNDQNSSGTQLPLVDDLIKLNAADDREFSTIQAKVLEAKAVFDVDPVAEKDTTDCNLAGDSKVVDLLINGDPALKVDLECNTKLNILGLIHIHVDEQTCDADNDELIVRALRVVVGSLDDPIVEVIASEVRVSGDGTCCACSNFELT